jgi:hypothetical protein
MSGTTAYGSLHGTTAFGSRMGLPGTGHAKAQAVGILVVVFPMNAARLSRFKLLASFARWG